MLGNETEVRWFTVVFLAVSYTEFHFSWCAALLLWSLATALAAAFISLRMSHVSYTGLFNVFFRFTDELDDINVNSATGMFDF